MDQWLNPHLALARIPYECQFVSWNSTSHPAPCLCPGKAFEDGPKKSLGLAHPHGIPEQTPGSQLWIGSAPTITTT